MDGWMDGLKGGCVDGWILSLLIENRILKQLAHHNLSGKNKRSIISLQRSLQRSFKGHLKVKTK